jgi:hypothetical protein
MWLYEQLEPGACAYIVPLAVRLNGKLDVRALNLSLQKIVQRHEVLRTVFTLAEDLPVQIIRESVEICLKIVDLSSCSIAERNRLVSRIIENDKRQPFDLSQGPMMRAILLRLDTDEFILLLTMHHIVSDGWSLNILMRELSILYGAYSGGNPAPLSELPIQYTDFAAWQRKLLRDGMLEYQLAYWMEQLADLPKLRLPTDKMTETPGLRAATESLALSEELTQDLKSMSRQYNVTLFIVMYATFQALLFRYTRQEDIVMGSPIANRNRAELEGLIGFFVNTLVLRTNLSGNPSFVELLGRSRDVMLNAYAHQDLPFDKLVGKLRPSRALGQVPLFRVFFALNNNAQQKIVVPDLAFSPLPLNSCIAKFDIEVSLVEIGGMLKCAIIYKTDLFYPSTIQVLLRRFAAFLQQAVIYPERRLLDFHMSIDQPNEDYGAGSTFQNDDKFMFE